MLKASTKAQLPCAEAQSTILRPLKGAQAGAMCAAAYAASMLWWQWWRPTNATCPKWQQLCLNQSHRTQQYADAHHQALHGVPVHSARTCRNRR